jgi:flavin reductase (DIM6/NTAB) family NADH-FMN oxidoreductase RutF
MKVETPVAVGHIPSGLFVIAGEYDGVKTGYLASWVQQVSFEPLLISFTIKPDRPGYQAILDGKTFTVNTVGDHEANYLKHFWSGFDPEKKPFDEIPHEISEDGGLLIKSAKSAFDCRFVSKSTPGDHDVFVAEVIASYQFNEGASPKVHIRKTGLDY